MKSRLFVLLAMLMAYSYSQAQGFHLGIKGGANITKIDGKELKDEFNYGYHLGGFAESGSEKNGLSSRKCCGPSTIHKPQMISKISSTTRNPVPATRTSN